MNECAGKAGPLTQNRSAFYQESRSGPSVLTSIFLIMEGKL